MEIIDEKLIEKVTEKQRFLCMVKTDKSGLYMFNETFEI